MDSFFLSILGFIVAIGILVTVHEFGHFWVARKLGVKVLRFSVGFGKPLYSWRGKQKPSASEPGDSQALNQTQDNTEYVIAAIPLGGYVKMLDEREGDVPEAELHRAFNRQSLPVRSAIVVAGPLFNLIFAIFAFWGVLVLGEVGLRPLIGEVSEDSPAATVGLVQGDEIVAVNQEPTPTWSRVLYQFAAASVTGNDIVFQVKDAEGGTQEHVMAGDVIGDLAEIENPLEKLGLTPDLPVFPPVMGRILEAEAAAAAGLKVGDRIASADGQSMDDWQSWVTYVRARPGQLIKLQVERDGQLFDIDLIPRASGTPDNPVGRIGAAAQVPEGSWDRYRVHDSMGMLEAIPAAAAETWDFSILTIKVMWRIVTGEASLKNLGGPITVADAAGQAVSAGLVQFLKLLAIISVSLGILNLLPVPVLDGGHLMYFAIEAIRGKPVSEKIMLQGQQIGMALLLALMGLVLYQDISRLIS
jgi:regulator of sigma E protease